MTDVIVVGGGVIGLSIAYELAGQGVSVQILDQGPLGQEASWAGAGILPPGNPRRAATPEARLRAESHRLWPEWTKRLLDETGIDNGYRNCGGIEVQLESDPAALQDRIAGWREEGVLVDELTAAELADLEPAVTDSFAGAYRLPELCQVRNPRHVKALIAGCAVRGVDFFPGQPVVGFERIEGRVAAVRTISGRYPAGRFVISAGAWSKHLLAEAGCVTSIEPVRGQIVLLQCQAPQLQHVVEIGPRYLVPRTDGRVLVGATEEWVGFDKRNTAGAVAQLLELATTLVPSLASARFERCWAGLRPRSSDGLPLLGAVPGYENLFLAAGHFRAGLQLSPATAVLMRQAILDEPTFLPLSDYSCTRHELETSI